MVGKKVSIVRISRKVVSQNTIFLPFSVFLVLAIFLFARAQIVFVGVYPYKKIAWLHGR